MNRPEYLIVHHTGGSDQDPLADTSHHTFKMIDALHKGKGWGKCGYHYFIEKDGKTTQGRLDNEEGAHTIGYNRKSIGICLAGNFDAFYPTQAQIDALKPLLEAKMALYGVPASRVVPHRLFASKTCFGRLLADNWAQSLVSKEDEVLKLTLQLKILQLKLAIMKLLGR